MTLIDYFTRKRDGHTAFILFDREIEPTAELPYSLQVKTALAEPALDGITSENDRAIVDQIADALVSVDGPHRYVGTVTAETEVTWYYYSSDPKSFEKAIAKLSLPREVVIHQTHDLNWNCFFECIAPDAIEYERITNRELISAFESDGDDIYEARNVIYWLYFGSDDARSFAHRALSNFNFEVYDSNHDPELEFPFSLGLQRSQPIDHTRIDEVTDRIMEVIAEVGGSFDGWEAQTRAIVG